MSQALPTIKQLRYFIALSKTAHFGRAAEHCCVSQSAFSVAIKELETQLGLQLVDRTSKQVTVTERGVEFANRARMILEQLEQLVDDTVGDTEPLSGKLKLGVIPTIAPFIIPKILASVRQDYPKLQLYLIEEQTQALYERLMLGELDLLLLALPYPLRGVIAQHLFDDHFHLAFHANSKHIKNNKLNPNNIPSDSILLLEDGHCLRDHAIDSCKLRNKGSISQFSATSLFTLLQMVDADMGVTYLPEMAVGSALLNSTTIHTLALNKKAYREIGLVWREGSAKAAEFEQLGKLIKAIKIHEDTF